MDNIASAQEKRQKYLFFLIDIEIRSRFWKRTAWKYFHFGECFIDLLQSTFKKHLESGSLKILQKTRSYIN